MALTTTELARHPAFKERSLKASGILYAWACDKITTHHAKAACASLGFTIDFRQADIGAYMEAEFHGTPCTLEV